MDQEAAGKICTNGVREKGFAILKGEDRLPCSGMYIHGNQDVSKRAAMTKKPKQRHAEAKRGKWSRLVTEQSNALDLEAGVFTFDDPRRIAASLKESADRSIRRKTDPFRSAMSMLNFYINRAGRNLPREQRARLEKAKDELRELFGRTRRQTVH
jgi:hypothetical protein